MLEFNNTHGFILLFDKFNKTVATFSLSTSYSHMALLLPFSVA
jgi:hypothetical protein